ncbi:hypothetical protein B0H10DRAFT_2087934, partial [Mycena sp. CBHHK59/15]
MIPQTGQCCLPDYLLGSGLILHRFSFCLLSALVSPLILPTRVHSEWLDICTKSRKLIKAIESDRKSRQKMTKKTKAEKDPTSGQKRAC